MRKKLFTLLFLMFLAFNAVACSTNIQPSSTDGTNSSNSLDLTGQVATEIPGTSIDLGTTVTSVLDADTKKREVFAVPLKAGETIQIQTTSTSRTWLELHKPGAVSVGDAGVDICPWNKACTENFTAAVDGTYYLEISTNGSGVKYTLTVNVQ